MRRESRGQEGEKEERDEKSTRTAPVTFQEESRQKRSRQKKDQSNHKQSMLTSHATFVLSTQPPKQEFIDRVRRRNAPRRQREAGGDEKEESQNEKKERHEEKKEWPITDGMPPDKRDGQSEAIVQIRRHEPRKHEENGESITSKKAKVEQAASGIQRKRLRESLEEQVEHSRVRKAILAEQRRKQLELDVINANNKEGHETSTTCMPKQSKDAAKQAFNMFLKKVETLKR